ISDAVPGGASYDLNFVSVHTAHFDLSPCFLARANGSTIFAALEAADPSLTFASLVELTQYVRAVVLYIGSDLCGAGQKAKFEFVRRAQIHNACAQRSRGVLGMIILVDGHCAAHVIHREVEHVFRLKELIPSLFAVSFTCGLPGAAAEIKSALARIVREDLSNGGFVVGLSPPADVFEAATPLLKLIFCRAVAAMADREDIEGKRVEALKKCREFQGTCCGGQKLDVCVQRMTDTLHDEFFQPLAVSLPAQNRWYTFGPSLTKTLGTYSIHKLLPRVFKRCFSHAAPPAEDDDSYRVYCHKRKKQAVEFLGSSDCDLALAAAFIAT
ncbi:unnamed protein product, partial [Prorocentrum cordatum]